MEILQRNIFGDVFYTGNLNNGERELITVAALATMQTLPQLKAHVGAALNVGNSPLAIRETIYQCAPFIGFPRTLNAIGVFNDEQYIWRSERPQRRLRSDMRKRFRRLLFALSWVLLCARPAR